jgi:asparagine synthetase B (glutamine-hydrolysing)
MGFLAGWVAPGRPVTKDVTAAASQVRRRLLHRNPPGPSGAGGLARERATRGVLLLGSDVATAAADGEGLTLAFDGRLDGRDALEARLQAAGHAPEGEGDAALLLAAWRAWGADLFPLLRGVFALVVHDAPAGTLTCTRDGFGQRPLFWHASGGAFVFASEIQALLAWPGPGRTADLDVIGHILSFGHAPVDRTALRGVHSVPPGHALTWRTNGSIDTTCWWRLPDPVNDPMVKAAPATEYRRRLRSAVARAAAGDGVAEVIGHGDTAAALVHAGGRLRQTVSDGPADLPALLSRLHLHAGQPILVPAPALAWLDASVRGASHPISDIGADTLLLGGRRYGEFATELERMRGDGRAPSWWRPSFNQAFPFARDLFQHATGCLTEAERMQVSGPGLAHTLLFAMPDWLGTSLEDASLDNCMDAASRLDLAQRLPGLELPLIDAVAASCGTRIACPFLDPEVVEWCLSVSQARRRAGLDGTGIRRIGTEAPVPAASPDLETEDWLPAEAATLRPWLADLLLGAACGHRGLFGRRRAEALVARCGTASPREARELWAMVGIELWFQAFVDQMPAEPPIHAEAPAEALAASQLVAVA